MISKLSSKLVTYDGDFSAKAQQADAQTSIDIKLNRVGNVRELCLLKRLSSPALDQTKPKSSAQEQYYMRLMGASYHTLN